MIASGGSKLAKILKNEKKNEQKDTLHLNYTFCEEEKNLSHIFLSVKLMKDTPLLHANRLRIKTQKAISLKS